MQARSWPCSLWCYQPLNRHTHMCRQHTQVLDSSEHTGKTITLAHSHMQPPAVAHLQVRASNVHGRKHLHAAAPQVCQPPLVALHRLPAAAVRLLQGQTKAMRSMSNGNQQCWHPECARDPQSMRSLKGADVSQLPPAICSGRAISRQRMATAFTSKCKAPRTCAVRSGSSPCCLSDWKGGMASAAARSSTLRTEMACGRRFAAQVRNANRARLPHQNVPVA